MATPFSNVPNGPAINLSTQVLNGGISIQSNVTMAVSHNKTGFITPVSFIIRLSGDPVLGTNWGQILIKSDVKRVLEIVFQIVIFLISSCLGIVANIINTKVYWKMGLRDSITLGFLSLSISDLLNVSIPVFISGCYIAKFIFPESPVYFIEIHYALTSWLRQMAYSFSCVITAFLSLERCCCVILPLKVKLIFTRKRTFIFIAVVLAFHIFCNIPVYATHQLRWINDPRRNNTQTFRVWFAPNRNEIEAFNYTVLSIITPTVSQFVLVCSAVIMVRGLIKSSTFKRSATGGRSHNMSLGAPKNTQGSAVVEALSPSPISGETTSGSSSTSNNKQDEALLSNRDLRLVRAMVFIVAILSACNIPYLSLVYTMLVEPEFNIRRAYHNTYSVMFSISIAMATFNSSANFIVYLKTSSRYREVLGQIFTSCNGALSKMGDQPFHA